MKIFKTADLRHPYWRPWKSPCTLPPPPSPPAWRPSAGQTPPIPPTGYTPPNQNIPPIPPKGYAIQWEHSSLSTYRLRHPIRTLFPFHVQLCHPIRTLLPFHLQVVPSNQNATRLPQPTCYTIQSETLLVCLILPVTPSNQNAVRLPLLACYTIQSEEPASLAQLACYSIQSESW